MDCQNQHPNIDMKKSHHSCKVQCFGATQDLVIRLARQRDPAEPWNVAPYRCVVTFSNKCLDIGFADPGCVGDIYFDLWCYVRFKPKHNIFEKSDPVLYFNLHAKASNRLLVGLWLHLSALLSWVIVFSDFMFAVIPFNRLLLLFLWISCKVLWHKEAVLLYSLIVRDRGNDFENVSLYNDHCQITVITSRVPMCSPCNWS